MPRIDAFLKIMSQVGASDLHIGDGSEPLVRINGALEKTKHKKLTVDEVRLLLYELLTDRQIQKFKKPGKIDIAYTLKGFAVIRWREEGGFQIGPVTEYPTEKISLPNDFVLMEGCRLLDEGSNCT